MPLTADQLRIVKATAPILKEYGTNITTLFYRTVLEEHPELNSVFNQTNQVNGHQAGALAGALYAYAMHIDNLGQLSPTVEKICHKHASLYIQPEHYGIVGEGVLRAFGEILGAEFTPDIHDAWAAAYWQLANVMIDRERQLYSEAHGWTDWREFRIANKIKESQEITSFYLEPIDGAKLPPFLPGQYISLLTDVPQFPPYQQSRQYSLSDAPSSDHYRISVKREPGLDTPHTQAPTHPGWISNILHDEKQIGDTVKISHPAGDFFYDPGKDCDGPIVLLSAGVGVTPMMSILNTIIRCNSVQPLSFMHGARTTSTQAFGAYVKKQARTHQNIRATFFVKSLDANDNVDSNHDHIGRLTIPTLAHTQSHDLYLEDAKTKYFVCGPESFMGDIRQSLINIGVKEYQIRLEMFGTGDLAW